MKKEKVTLNKLLVIYCHYQENEPEELRQALETQVEKFGSKGFMLLKCAMLDSSRLGDRVILGYGGNHTYPEIPDKPISPRGVTSDMSVVELYYEVDTDITEEARAATLIHKMSKRSMRMLCENCLGMAAYEDDEEIDLKLAIADSFDCGDVTLSDLQTF
jgi:hypothetical protein